MPFRMTTSRQFQPFLLFFFIFSVEQAWSQLGFPEFPQQIHGNFGVSGNSGKSPTPIPPLSNQFQSRDTRIYHLIEIHTHREREKERKSERANERERESKYDRGKRLRKKIERTRVNLVGLDHACPTTRMQIQRQTNDEHCSSSGKIFKQTSHLHGK